jgi:hypothetical protein
MADVRVRVPDGSDYLMVVTRELLGDRLGTAIRESINDDALTPAFITMSQLLSRVQNFAPPDAVCVGILSAAEKCKGGAIQQYALEMVRQIYKRVPELKSKASLAQLIDSALELVEIPSTANFAQYLKVVEMAFGEEEYRGILFKKVLRALSPTLLYSYLNHYKMSAHDDEADWAWLHARQMKRVDNSILKAVRGGRATDDLHELTRIAAKFSLDAEHHAYVQRLYDASEQAPSLGKVLEATMPREAREAREREAREREAREREEREERRHEKRLKSQRESPPGRGSQRESPPGRGSCGSQERRRDKKAARLYDSREEEPPWRCSQREHDSPTPPRRCSQREHESPTPSRRCSQRERLNGGQDEEPPLCGSQERRRDKKTARFD